MCRCARPYVGAGLERRARHGTRMTADLGRAAPGFQEPAVPSGRRRLRLHEPRADVAAGRRSPTPIRRTPGAASRRRLLRQRACRAATAPSARAPAPAIPCHRPPAPDPSRPPAEIIDTIRARLPDRSNTGAPEAPKVTSQSIAISPSPRCQHPTFALPAQRLFPALGIGHDGDRIAPRPARQPRKGAAIAAGNRLDQLQQRHVMAHVFRSIPASLGS